MAARGSPSVAQRAAIGILSLTDDAFIFVIAALLGHDAEGAVLIGIGN